MPFFSSPTSNILSSTFAPASVAMSRSDSRDSATSTTSFSSQHCAWDIRPHSSSSFSSQHTYRPSHRRTSSSSSSSGWTPSPYRSCLSQACDTNSSSSYLSDDDLLDLPIDVIESPVQQELSTEQQIEMLRAYREREESSHHAHRLQPAAKPEIWVHHQQAQQQQQQKKTARVVRFASDQSARPSSGARRRPSGLRRS